MLGMLMAFSHRNARDRLVTERPLSQPLSSVKLEAVE
jgi:hypothetical protein